MIDAGYFRNRFAKDVATVGDVAVVEMRLLNGQFHRVHNISSMEDGYVVVEAYELRGNEVVWKEQWQEQVLAGKAPHALNRAIVPYESILDVVILPGRLGDRPRIGFGTK
jgi:hypothetical protein